MQRLFALLLFALLIRGGVQYAGYENLSADVDGYRWLAESLANHGVFGAVDEQGVAHPTAFRPILYPYLLSWCVLDGELNNHCIFVMHLLLALATVAGTYWLGSRMLSPRAGLIAGAVVAIDPILLVQSTQSMTETLAAALAVGTWCVWLALVRHHECDSEEDSSGVRPSTAKSVVWSLVLAVFLIAAFFCRPTFLIWAVLLCAWMGMMALRRRAGWPVRTAGIVAIGLLFAISIWAARNQRQLGKPVWATSHGGYTLLLGNNPPFYDYLRNGSFGVAWEAEPFHRAWTMRHEADPLADDFWRQHSGSVQPPPPIGDELADDALAYLVAKQTIRDQPKMFVWACVVRAGRLWSPLPHRTPQRSDKKVWAVGAFYFVLFAAVLWGALHQRRRLLRPAWVAGILLAVSLTAVHLVYWSNMRMRAPATPLLALLAAAAICRRDEFCQQEESPPF